MTYQRIQASIASIDADAKALSEALTLRAAERDAATAQIQVLNASVAAKEAALVGVSQDRDAKAAEIAMLKAEIVTLKARIAELIAPPVTPPPTPIRLFTTQVPSQPNNSDGSTIDYELGTRFSASTPGEIRAVRYFKATGESGAHIGRIWSSTGALLASVAFTNETASGWQEQALPTPLAIAANTTYVVSVNVRSHYASTQSGFSNAISNGGLTAPVGAGVYNDTPGSFPTQSWQNTNYFRDIAFVATVAPPPVTPPPVTPPPVTPPPVTPPPTGTLRGWQLTATNTGLAAHGINGSRLPVYSGPSEIPAGSRLTGVRFTGNISLYQGNIVIEKCMFQPTSASRGMPIVTTTNYGGQAEPGKGAVVIRDCEFDGSLLPLESAAYATGFMGIADLQRNYCHHFGSGFALINTGAQLDSVVENNFIAFMLGFGDGATTGNHSDAFTIRDFTNASRPSRNAVVRNNRFDCYSSNSTGAFFVQAWGNRINNVTVEGNLLQGEGYNLALEADRHGYGNVSAINNRFTPSVNGTWGTTYTSGGEGWTTWRDNFIYSATAPDGRGAVVNP